MFVLQGYFCLFCLLVIYHISLLLQSADDRNNLEKLTLAVLTHLPTAILYVHDLSGECGTSPSDQVLYQYLLWDSTVGFNISTQHAIYQIISSSEWSTVCVTLSVFS